MNEKELDLLENIINIAIDECPVEDTQKIVALERKIKSFVSLCKKQKEVIDKIKSLIKSKDNGTCIQNNEERGAYTFVLDFDKAREFIWNLEDILKEVSE